MSERQFWTRRRLLASGAVGATASLGGCISQFTNQDESTSQLSIADFRGSGPMVESRSAPGGTSMDDLPDLDGTLQVYLGGGEGGLYENLVRLLEQKYSNFTAKVRMAPSTQLANEIIEVEKGGESPADVFWSIDSTSLGLVADAGITSKLPQRVVKPVPDGFRDGDRSWVGVAGRARSIPYNTDEFSESDIPNKVQQFTQASNLKGAMGWAPTYGAFKSFVTAMRLLEGPEATKQWLRGMQNQNVSRYPDEF